MHSSLFLLLSVVHDGWKVVRKVESVSMYNVEVFLFPWKTTQISGTKHHNCRHTGSNQKICFIHSNCCCNCVLIKCFQCDLLQFETNGTRADGVIYNPDHAVYFSFTGDFILLEEQNITQYSPTQANVCRHSGLQGSNGYNCRTT